MADYSSYKIPLGYTGDWSVEQYAHIDATEAVATTLEGKGTVFTYNIGTSGATVPVCNAANTWGAAQYIQLGAVGTPSLAFTGDTNTGIYSPGADSIAVSVGGTQKVVVGASHVGIELYNATTSGNGLNFRPSLGDSSRYNMSITAYDHSGGGTGPTDGLSINGYDGISICTGSSTDRQERLRVNEQGLVGFGTSTLGADDGSLRVNIPNTGANPAIVKATGLLSGSGIGRVIDSQVNVTTAHSGVSAFRAEQGTISGSVTNLYGYNAGSSLVGGTNNYGFYSNIASAAGRWNFYANGTASNYFGGLVDISGASAGQIKFPATQNASSDANTLDDYEEGTWTPVLTDGTNNATASTAVGTYTKIGRLVHAKCKIVISSLGSASGTIYISGLPFASSSTANTNATAQIGYATGMALGMASYSLSGHVVPGASRISVVAWDATTGVSSFTAAKWSATGEAVICTTYII